MTSTATPGVPGRLAPAYAWHLARRLTSGGRFSVILAACLALPAAAQEVTMHTTPDALAVITLHNEATSFRDDLHTFQTPAGDVVVRHETTPNGGGGCCPDTLTAVDWPDGYYPDPLVLEVPEGAAGAIEVLPMVGM